MGLCDCCSKTFCMAELSDFRDKLAALGLIFEVEDIDTSFCIDCVKDINGLSEVLDG